MSRDSMLSGAMPFALEGRSVEAVLCLHGFTGSPGIYRQLARELNAEGLTICVPALPGHATKPEDMLGCTAEDWLGFARQELERLQGRYAKVHLVGLSLGGALCSLLAAENGAVASLSLLSPAYGIEPQLSVRLGLGAQKAPPTYMVPIPTRQPTGGELDECIFGYSAFPLVASAELHRACDMAREVCRQIRTPTLFLYTAADRIADPEQCRLACDEIGSVEESCRYEHSEHNLLLGCDREDVKQRIKRHILRHTSN